MAVVFWPRAGKPCPPSPYVSAGLFLFCFLFFSGGMEGR